MACPSPQFRRNFQGILWAANEQFRSLATRQGPHGDNAMSKGTSINIAEIENNRGQKPDAEARGLRLTVKPVKFIASVKADGSMKTIGLNNIRITIDTAEAAAQSGFPIGSVIAVNAYLPAKRADKEQLARSVRNWRAAQAAKKTGGGEANNVADIETDEDEDNRDE